MGHILGAAGTNGARPTPPPNSRANGTRPFEVDVRGPLPTEERAWTRGRCMRLLGIEEARTRSEYVTTILNK